MIRHENFTSVLFNTPRISSTKDGEWFIDEFDETPKMSSYLVAFVVSNFEMIQDVTTNGIDIEVAGRPEAINNGDGEFALDEAKNIIEFFENYFNVPYPLKKSSNNIL